MKRLACLDSLPNSYSNADERRYNAPTHGARSGTQALPSPQGASAPGRIPGNCRESRSAANGASVVKLSISGWRLASRKYQKYLRPLCNRLPPNSATTASTARRFLALGLCFLLRESEALFHDDSESESASGAFGSGCGLFGGGVRRDFGTSNRVAGAVIGRPVVWTNHPGCQATGRSKLRRRFRRGNRTRDA